MDVEYWIGSCESEIAQIRNYDPDPYYVGYFFQSYLDSVSSAYNGIFEEANRDFGMFVPRCNKDRFSAKSILKGDSNAMEFVAWYEKKMGEEHRSRYPAFMQKIMKSYEYRRRLPGIKIMLRAEDRYKDDVFQEIFASLSHGRLRSREELQMEINRQAPIFLEMVNHKRVSRGEPQVSNGGVVASAFFEGFDGFEIVHVAEVYMQVVKRVVSDSRRKIKELTTFR